MMSVIKEELEFIISIGDIDSVAAQEVLSRPDPLALLEKWMENEYKKLMGCDGEDEVNDFYKELILDMQDVISKIRTNPEEVRQQGIEDGWWHDD